MTQALLKVRCPHCRFRFKVELKYAGRVARCPKAECDSKLRIPDTQQSTHTSDKAQTSRTQAASETRARRNASKTTRSVIGGLQTVHDRKPQPKDHYTRQAKNDRRQKTGSPKPRLQFWQIATGTLGLLLAVLAILFAPNGNANPQNNLVAGIKNQTEEAPAPDVFKEKLHPFVTKYCADCHNEDDPEAGINFSAYATEASILKGDGRKS